MVMYLKLLVILIVVGVVFISTPVHAQSNYCDAKKAINNSHVSTEHANKHSGAQKTNSANKKLNTTSADLYRKDHVTNFNNYTNLTISDIDDSNGAIQARVRYEESLAEIRSEREAELLLLDAERNGQTTVNFLK